MDLKIGDEVKIVSCNVKAFIKNKAILIEIDTKNTSIPYLVSIKGRGTYWCDEVEKI